MPVVEEIKFFYQLNKCVENYFIFSSRSNKKLLSFQLFLKSEIETFLNYNNLNYTVKIEEKINCLNFNSCKKVDLIILKNNIPFLIFPIKFICRNYLQNRNNYLEQLTGESFLIKQKNNVKIIPINILIKNIHYYDKNNQFKKIEKIPLNIFDVYEDIILFDDTLNLLLNVNYKTNKLNKIYNYKSFQRVLYNQFF